MATFSEHRHVPFKIAAIYALVAALWILSSDQLLAALITDHAAFVRMSILKGWLFVAVTTLLLLWLVRHFLSEQSLREENLRELVQEVSEATGEEFFNQLVKHLAGTIKADYAMVGELSAATPPRIRTIAMCGNGVIMENMEYSLAGTPCAEVVYSGGKGCFHPSGVSGKFPGDNLLAKMSVEGYIGTPLLDSGGRTLGLMAAFSCRPISEKGMAKTLFRLFAVRAAAELERRQDEQKILNREHQLEILSNSSKQINTILDIPTISRALAAAALLLVKGEGCGVGLMQQGAMVFSEYNRWGKSVPIDYTFPQGEGVPGWVMATRAPYFSNDARNDPHVIQEIREALGFDNLANVPILSRTGELLGCCEVHNKEGSALFDELDIAMLQSLADSAAVALENAAMLFELKQAKEATQNQFKLLTTIFDSVNAVIYVANITSNELMYLNKYGASLYGKDWQGKRCFDVLQEGMDGPCPFCSVDSLVIDGEPQAPFVWEFMSSATGRWYQGIERAIRWTDGSLVRMEIAFDISERKEMERMKDELVSAVSHEMRTPLTAMLGYTEFMLDNEVPAEQQKEYLRTVQQQTERLNELIGNFLDLQRLKMRPEQSNMTHLSVAALLAETAEPFTATPRLHRLEMHCPPDLPLIVGDVEQLRQVLRHLLANAVKYSPPGSLITLGAESSEESVVIRVTDQGTGIPVELQEKIFECFYRIDNTDRRLVSGVGLGLALVREIVTAHNGTVWVENSNGAGSTFCVKLPTVPESIP